MTLNLCKIANFSFPFKNAAKMATSSSQIHIFGNLNTFCFLSVGMFYKISLFLFQLI